MKEGNKTYGKCKKCGHTMTNNADRIKIHLAKCKTVEHVQEGRKYYVNVIQIVPMESDIKSLENNIFEKGKKMSLIS